MSDLLGRRARDLYEQAVVWDTHSGFMPDPKADLNNLKIWRDAGVNYLSVNVGFDKSHISVTRASSKSLFAEANLQLNRNRL
jgi:hypothetical protein